jgi:multidrug transporter EmrE-like cation transporter
MSLLGAVVADQAALSTIKLDVTQNIPYFIPLTFVFGGLAYYFLSDLIKTKGMAISNGMWNVLSTIFGTIIGFMLWKENISFKQFIGISIGLISLYLMNGAEN